MRCAGSPGAPGVPAPSIPPRTIELIELVTKVLDVRYDPHVTATARETVARRAGNCLSIATLFVGLAREAGLEAYYIEAYDRGYQFRQEADLIVSVGHVTAQVVTERGPLYLDFAGTLKSYRHIRRMDDMQALAHFFNNRGYESIQLENAATAGPPDWARAARNFELASAIDPDYAAAINNLGLVLTRMGRFDDAETQYRRAIVADPAPGFSPTRTLEASI